MEVRYGPYPWYFLWSFVLGVALAAVYDLLRLSRRIIKTSDLIVNLEDILFLLVSGVTVLASAYINNNGELRAYGFLGTVLGFVVYRLLFGMRIVDLLALIYNALKTIVCKVVGIILLPVRAIIKITGKPIFVTIGTKAKNIRGKIALKFAKRQE